MMNELTIIYEVLNEIKNRTNKLGIVGSGSLICMLAEEWCKAHNEDVVVFVNQLAYLVAEVNRTEGRY